MELYNEKSENTVIEINRIFRYIISGFILSFVDIQIGIISCITLLLSGLLFYLAVRMIRGVNRSFRHAYFFSLVFIIVNMLYLVLIATPYEVYYLKFILIFIGIIRILFIIKGFYDFLKDKYHIKMVLIFYLINLLIALFAYLQEVISPWLLIIVAIICFVLMIYHFKMINKIIIENNNIDFSDVKVTPIKFGLGYSTITIILCLVMTFITVTTYYHYGSNKDWIEFNPDTALDYKKSTVYDKKGKKLIKVEAYLFKDDDRYRNYIVVSDLKDEIYYQQLDVRLANTNIIHNYFTYKTAYQNSSNNKIYQTALSTKRETDYFMSEDITIHETYFGRGNPKKCFILVEYNLREENLMNNIYVRMNSETMPSYPFKNKDFESSSSFMITIIDDKIEISKYE